MTPVTALHTSCQSFHQCSILITLTIPTNGRILGTLQKANAAYKNGELWIENHSYLFPTESTVLIFWSHIEHSPSFAYTKSRFDPITILQHYSVKSILKYLKLNTVWSQSDRLTLPISQNSNNNPCPV